MRIDINITSRDRATEIYGLLASLREQEFQDFDIYILDDASGTPLQNFYFFNTIVQRLKFEGHHVVIMRNFQSKGVCKARQQLVDYCMEHGRGELICRLDDDTLLPANYLRLLHEGIIQGYDLVSGVTPPLQNPESWRDIKYIEPIINRVVLDQDGSFLFNGDDCGIRYNEDKLLLAHHFRSNALYSKKLHKAGIKYDDILALHGFREEEFFSLRAILQGFKLGVRTGAIAWHLHCPSGGERRPEIAYHDSMMNQQLLNRTVKKWYAQYGDFISIYNKCHGIDETQDTPLKNQYKSTNLIYSKED